MAERLPPGTYDTKPVRPVYSSTNILPQDSSNSTSSPAEKPNNSIDELLAGRTAGMYRTGTRQTILDMKETERYQINFGGYQNPIPSPNTAGPPLVNTNSSQVEAEWIEQYEPGVYLTLVALVDGTRELKRVRFRCDQAIIYKMLRLSDVQAHDLSLFRFIAE
jgi:Transcription factor regulating root and shoot growth via Pin3